MRKFKILSTCISKLHGSLLISTIEQERLPYNEGWRRPNIQTNAVTLVPLIVKLMAAGGEILPEALRMAENTLTKILKGQPIEGMIGAPIHK